MSLFTKLGLGLLGTPRVRHTNLDKVTADRAFEVCARFELGESAQELLTEDIGCADFFRLLVKQRHHRDAVSFLSYALPVRAAVLWGCRSARALLEPAETTAALDAAEAWVDEPNEANREAARIAALNEGFDLPQAVSTCLALAAASSGGTLCEPGGDEPPTNDSLSAHFVAGAVLLAAAQRDKEFQSRIAATLELGVEVADGGETEGTDPGRSAVELVPS